MNLSITKTNPITIAIDGHSGCGKSTTAKGVARKLGFLYIDSGAMYRAVTLYFLRHNIPFENENPLLLKALSEIHLDFEVCPETGLPEVTLNGEKVESEIRKPEIANHVSPVAALPIVRKAMVKQQQQIGAEGGIVMDGRDIGTIVFPHAELKVFMTANVEVRAARRQKELAEKGISQSLDEVIANLSGRDKIDSSRSEGPLRRADDAQEIDTGLHSIEEQVEIVYDWAKEMMVNS